MGRESTPSPTHEFATHPGAQEGKRGIFSLKKPKRLPAAPKPAAEHTDRSHDHFRSAISALAGHLGRSTAQLPTEVPDHVEKTKDEPRTVFQRPSTGRTTALGRRVEKPGTGRQSGPSGQTDGTKHDRKHTNK